VPTELVPLSPARRDLLARLLRGEGGEAADRVPGIVPRARGGAAPLSFAQEEVLERERDVPGIPPLFNECVTVHMPGPLRQEPLERALTEIVRRHEIWRTTFGGDGGCLLQVIAPPPPRVGLPRSLVARAS